MSTEAAKLVSDLRLRPGSNLLVVGDVGPQALEALAEAVGGLENILLLHREPEPPIWAQRLTDRGLRARRSMVLEHNDFLATSSFDAVLAQDVLHRLLGKREFLNEAYRLLKPGGRASIIQRLWPLTSLRRGEFRKLLEKVRSYTPVESRIGIFSAYVVLERPA
ncbi:MAG: methyltransferase domain-containing protein [Nitrososphaerota archaeon]